jgi:mannan endo-1,4-beta-mannosidase
MKTLIYFLVLTFISLCSFDQKLPVPAYKLATKETVNLFRFLHSLQKNGVMYGHQDDLMYGSTRWYDKDRSDTKDFTDDYRAVAGFKLVLIEYGNDRS